MKNCSTCKWLMYKCSGECHRCGHKVPEDTYQRYERIKEGLLEEKCKCIECNVGEVYRYYEEDPELADYYKKTEDKDEILHNLHGGTSCGE